MGRLVEFIIDTIETFYKRNQLYKDSWKQMDAVDLAAFIRGKAARVYATLTNGGDPDKIIDDLKDIINYSAMVAVKIKEQNGDIFGRG